MKKNKIIPILIVILICITTLYFNSWVVKGSAVNKLKLGNSYNVIHKSYVKPINKTTQYINKALGYKFSYPQHMKTDNSLNPIKTVISDYNTQIEIYYDNFKNTVHFPTSYINYSNNFIFNNKAHTKDSEEYTKINGLKTHILVWHREKLSKIENDKNYYVSAEIIKNEYEVYTLFIKSNKPFTNKSYLKVLNNFNVIDKTEKAKLNVLYKNTSKTFNEETADFYDKYFLKSNDLKWGIFENTAPTSFDFLDSLEKKLDFKFEFLLKYQSFSSGKFPMEEMKKAYDDNRYVELTLQTNHLDGTDNSSVTYDILQGKYDDFFNDYAKQIKLFNRPILFRLNNEMNGDWCMYSSYHSCKDTLLYNEVWRYVYNIFKKNGVDNALWVWNPHDKSFPKFAWNHYLNYYPGDEYVDLIGVTGYNTGTYYEGEVWRDFNEIYVPIYDEYTQLFTQPFIITEFGSNSVGGDKIAWINEMFNNINRFPKIKVAIWWNGIDWDIDKTPARVYRLDETDKMIKTFKKGFAEYK